MLRQARRVKRAMRAHRLRATGNRGVTQLKTSKRRTTNETTTMKTSALENQMNKRASRIRATLTVITAGLLFTTAALAQMPTSPWKKAAPFPEPDEELYGVACNGKMYVIGGWGDGKARGINSAYTPGSATWQKNKSMP